MSSSNAPIPFEFSIDLELNDYLFSAWIAHLQRRNRIQLKSSTQPPSVRVLQVGRSIWPFVLGVCLGLFNFNAVGFMLIAAAIATGCMPEITPYQSHVVSAGAVLVGFIWFWLLAGRWLERNRCESAWLKYCRTDFPEILGNSVPVSISLLADSVSITMLGGHSVVPIRSIVRLFEIDDYFILRTGITLLPIAKGKLSSQTQDGIRNWAKGQNIFFVPDGPRRNRVPRRISVALGAVLCILCLWVGTHIRVQPQSVAYPTSVKLALRDATTIIAGQAVQLEKLSYSASVNQAVLYDSLSGYVSRPEISGTFFVDRNGTPFLARTAEDEFADERTWHLTIGQIPADATMEALPGSGVYIAWEQPFSADYPGHCGALRSNSGTTPLSAGRFMWRGRLFLEVCSATMSKTEVREWMFHAIEPLNRELALRTQTAP